MHMWDMWDMGTCAGYMIWIDEDEVRKCTIYENYDRVIDLYGNYFYLHDAQVLISVYEIVT